MCAYCIVIWFYGYFKKIGFMFGCHIHHWHWLKSKLLKGIACYQQSKLNDNRMYNVSKSLCILFKQCKVSLIEHDSRNEYP